MNRDRKWYKSPSSEQMNDERIHFLKFVNYKWLSKYTSQKKKEINNKQTEPVWGSAAASFDRRNEKSHRELRLIRIHRNKWRVHSINFVNKLSISLNSASRRRRNAIKN